MELEKKSKGLELEINRLNAVLEEAKGEGKKEQMAIDKYTLTLKVELDKKEKFIQNVAKEVERQREIVKGLELERTQLKNDLDESGRNHQNSLRSLTAGDKASKGLIDGLESAQALLKEKNDEVEKLTSELANRVGELEKENKKVQNLEQEIASLQISLKESKGEHDKVLQELAKSNETIKKSNNELTELRRKNEVLVRENSSLKSGLDGAEKSLDRSRQIHAKGIENRDKDLATEKAKSTNLNSELDNKKMQIETLGRNIKGLNDELTKTKSELDIALKKLQEVPNLSRKVEELKNQSEEVKKREKDISSLKAELVDAEKLIKVMSDRIALAEKSNDFLRGNSDKISSESSTLKSEIATLENQLKKKESELTIQTEDLKKKSESIQALEEKATEFKDEISSLNTDLKKAQTKNQKMDDAVAQSVNSYLKLKTELDDLKKSFPLADSNLRLKKELEDERTKSRNLGNELDANKMMIAKLGKDIDDAHKENVIRFEKAQKAEASMGKIKKLLRLWKIKFGLCKLNCQRKEKQLPKPKRS